MLKQIQSFFLYLIVQIDRVIDHSWRYLTGLPLARRSVITPDIFLGGQYGLQSVSKLKLLGVTAVVNMRERSIHKDLKELEVKVLNLPTKDKTAPTIENLKKGSKFIEQEIKKGGKVYIHCWWGEERGPTMAIAYLIWTGLTFDDAFKLVKKTRTFINPVPAQIARLKEFEKEVDKLKNN
jgi:protein-tyrosine phosphatase